MHFLQRGGGLPKGISPADIANINWFRRHQPINAITTIRDVVISLCQTVRIPSTKKQYQQYPTFLLYHISLLLEWSMQIADTQMTIQRSLGWAINLQYLEIRSIGNFIQKNETEWILRLEDQDHPKVVAVSPQTGAHHAHHFVNSCNKTSVKCTNW